MTFLSPWIALFAGAVAVPLLVLLYLLKLRRRPMRVSSTLLWEQTVKDLHANEPFRWLRPSVLLFLQLAAVLCLLLALARPVIPGDTPLGSRVVIMIDASASMNAPVDSGETAGDAADSSAGGRATSDSASPSGLSTRSRFEAARERALELIDQLARTGGGGSGGGGGGAGAADQRGERPEAMVVVAAATCRAVTPFTPDVRELRDAVRALRVTDEALSLEAIGTLARAMALTSAPTTSTAIDTEADSTSPRDRSSREPVRAVFISDGGIDPAAWRAQVPRAGLRWSFLPATPPRGARSTTSADPADPAESARTVAPTEASLRGNIGIINLSARRQVDDPSTIRVFARVTSSFTSPQRVALVIRVVSADSLSKGDGSSASNAAISRAATLELPAAQTQPAGARQPSEATASLDVISTEACLITAEISQPDQLRVDNFAGVFMDESRRPRVLVVVPNLSDPLSARTGGAGVGAASVGGVGGVRARGGEGLTSGTPLDRADAFLISALDAALGLSDDEVANDARQARASRGSLRVVDLATFDRGLAMTTAGTVAPGEWGAGSSDRGYDVVIFDRAAPLPGRVPPMPSLSFGAPMPGVAELGGVGVSASTGAPTQTTRFLTWERTHPVMRDVKLDTVVVRPARAVLDAGRSPRSSAASTCQSTPLALATRTPSPVTADQSAGGQAQTLIAAFDCAQTASQDAAADASLTVDRSTRRIVVGFELAQSNWGPSESFPIFLTNALDWLTRDSFAGVASAVRTGETAVVGVPGGMGAALVRIVPIGESGAVQVREVRGDAESVLVGPFAKVGLYRVVAERPDGREVRSPQPVLPVNLLDATEAACVQRESLDLGGDGDEGEGASGAAFAPNRTADGATGRGFSGGREVWVWFVYLAAALLCIEWFVYAWRSRS